MLKKKKKTKQNFVSATISSKLFLLSVIVMKYTSEIITVGTGTTSL